eukprot:PhM_4_TR10619/c0_g1_i1/m.85480
MTSKPTPVVRRLNYDDVPSRLYTPTLASRSRATATAEQRAAISHKHDQTYTPMLKRAATTTAGKSAIKHNPTPAPRSALTPLTTNKEAKPVPTAKEATPHKDTPKRFSRYGTTPNIAPLHDDFESPPLIEELEALLIRSTAKQPQEVDAPPTPSILQKSGRFTTGRPTSSRNSVKLVHTSPFNAEQTTDTLTVYDETKEPENITQDDVQFAPVDDAQENVQRASAVPVADAQVEDDVAATKEDEV